MAATAEQIRKLTDPELVVPHLLARVSRKKKGDDKRGEVVAYIQARGAAEVADTVLGPESWSFEIMETAIVMGSKAVCRGRLTIALDGGGEIVRMDIGTTSMQVSGAGEVKDDSITTALKGAPSDAFKRCWAQLGLGRCLGRLSKPWVDLDEWGKLTNEKATLDRWVRELRPSNGAGPAPTPTHESAPALEAETEPLPDDVTPEQVELAKARWDELLQAGPSEEFTLDFLGSKGIVSMRQLLDDKLFGDLLRQIDIPF